MKSFTAIFLIGVLLSFTFLIKEIDRSAKHFISGNIFIENNVPLQFDGNKLFADNLFQKDKKKRFKKTKKKKKIKSEEKKPKPCGC